jgi:hypothetical protein
MFRRYLYRHHQAILSDPIGVVFQYNNCLLEGLMMAI